MWVGVTKCRPRFGPTTVSFLPVWQARTKRVSGRSCMHTRAKAPRGSSWRVTVSAFVLFAEFYVDREISPRLREPANPYYMQTDSFRPGCDCVDYGFRLWSVACITKQCQLGKNRFGAFKTSCSRRSVPWRQPTLLLAAPSLRKDGRLRGVGPISRMFSMMLGWSPQ